MLTTNQLLTMREVAEANGIEYPALRAFCEVEAGNQVFARVRGRDMPLIRWEGHYFDRLVKATFRAVARSQKLASTKVGGIPNPKTQEARYDLLDRAKALDYPAAVMSASWGFGQVMGEHWKLFGMSSAREFEDKAVSGFRGQLELVVLFLVKKNVTKFLKLKDWAAVARLYNGPAYAKNNYDVKLATAYAKYANDNVVKPKNVTVPAVGMLRPGSKGPDVRELQTLLTRAGFITKVDGDYGGTTRDNVEAFQRSNMLQADGVAGPATMAALLKYRATANEKLAIQPLMATKEVRDSAVPIAATFGVAGFKDDIVGLASQLSIIGSDTATTIANYLQAGATIVGIGLTVYAFYGWWKTKKNIRGIEDRVPEIKQQYEEQFQQAA